MICAQAFAMPSAFSFSTFSPTSAALSPLKHKPAFVNHMPAASSQPCPTQVSLLYSSVCCCLQD